MGFLFSKPSYDPKRDIPDLTGKVVVVTGANAGIGAQTVEQLAQHGAKVYLACRTESKARATIADIEKANPALKGHDRLVWLPLDLGSLRSAKKAAEEFLAKEKRLDVLINNAGRLTAEYTLTSEGIEESVAVNHLGHLVFTTTLLPLMKETAKEKGSDVRIVNVSSMAHQWAGATKFESVEDFNDPHSPPGKENVWKNQFSRYCTSKLMNILFTKELQRRLDEEGVPITSISLHPGSVATEGATAKPDTPWFIHFYMKNFGTPPLDGAFTTLFAATDAHVAAERDKYKGGYLIPFGQLKEPGIPARDPKLARTLWETSERVVKEVLARPT